jgi:hypothetical protein
VLDENPSLLEARPRPGEEKREEPGVDDRRAWAAMDFLEPVLGPTVPSCSPFFLAFVEPGGLPRLALGFGGDA